MAGALPRAAGTGAPAAGLESSADVSGSETVRHERIVERLSEKGLSPRWEGEPPPSFSGLTDDSREVGDGDLFCAVPGLRVDGHAFLSDARRAGAAGAVVERRDPGVDLPQLVVDDGRTALAHLASLFHGDPSRALAVTGVTGTNGKTTTVWLLRHLLSRAGPAASVGTLGVIGPDGERTAGDLTTPGPVELQRELAELRDGAVERVAMEVSSHALDQRRVDGIAFAALAYTNLSREHLDYHADMEDYRAAKLRAVELLRDGGLLVVNADEPAWDGLGAPSGARRVTFGTGAGADVRAVKVRHAPDGSRWTLAAGEERISVDLPMPGDFNVHNALAAAAVALGSGMEPRAVAAALSRAPQIPGRMEVLHRDGALVIRDYAHTPDALRRALEVLRPPEGRLAVVFGCGGDRDAGKRPEMGRVAEAGADRVFVTTDNPRSEDPVEIARQVVAGMRHGSHAVVLDRREAIAAALAWAGPGDVVLLAGKGHETYQALADGKVPFDEAAIVDALVAEEAP